MTRRDPPAFVFLTHVAEKNVNATPVCGIFHFLLRRLVPVPVPRCLPRDGKTVKRRLPAPTPTVAPIAVRSIYPRASNLAYENFLPR